MPNAAEPIYAIINPLYSLKAYYEIEKWYNVLLKINPMNTKANYYMGLIYYFKKDYQKAKNTLIFP